MSRYTVKNAKYMILLLIMNIWNVEWNGVNLLAYFENNFYVVKISLLIIINWGLKLKTIHIFGSLF